MTSSSDPKARRPTPSERLHGAAPEAAPHPAAGHARFIPREELRGFSAWSPGSFGASAGVCATPAAPPPLTAELLAAQVQAARQAGYHDGYRDGLVALEGFKQSYAQQVTAQVVTLAQSLQQRIEQLELALAGQVAEVAIALARQVLRSEIAHQPGLVAAVAQEALAATLVAARQIAVHVHPEDHVLIGQQAGDALAARGARLVSDAAITRGGCVIDSEVGVIDASVEARWRRATAAMGRPSEYGQETEAHGGTRESDA